MIHHRPSKTTLPTYGALLVEAAARVGGDDLVRCATRLANRFDADLLGLTTPAMIQDRPAHPPRSPRPPLDESVIAHMDAVGRQFCTWSEPVNASVSWRSLRLPIDEALACEAHACDLIVAARSASVEERCSPALCAAISTVGRPILVVPQGCEGFEAHTLLVCWNDSRECRRATLDAMPFLARAAKVMVLAVSYEPTPTRMSHRLDEVCAALQQRGVAALPLVLHKTHRSLAETVNAAAADHGADLVVAGAYGHGPLYRAAMGSTTDALLNKSSQALLLSR